MVLALRPQPSAIRRGAEEEKGHGDLLGRASLSEERAEEA